MLMANNNGFKAPGSKVINGHTVGTPDMLPRLDRYGRIRNFAQRGMTVLYIAHGIPAGVYLDRAGHVWTWNAQVGWVVGASTRYLQECYRVTLRMRYKLSRGI